MQDERDKSGQSAATNPVGREGHVRSRRLIRRGIVVTVVVALLGLFVSYAPRYVLRYLVASELDALGIEHQGLRTLDINPWTRELWLGPVRFGAGPSDRGQLGELGLTLRLNPLIQNRVSAERLLIRGIDVVVTRDSENELRLNGIPLTRFMTPVGAAGKPAKDGDVWNTGADTFEVRASRLIFRNEDGGEIGVDVERLALLDFKTWEPDRPGRFELTARVNDIRLNWSGEARPFADDISFTIDSRTEQADVPKVVRFTGPWGLDRRDGTYDARLKYELTLSASGRLEGRTVGTIDIEGADYARSGVFALTLERAKLDLDIHYALSESGDFTLQGKVVVDLGPNTATFDDKTRYAAAAGRFSMQEIDAKYAKGGILQIASRPEVDLEGIALSGPIEISVDRLLELLVLLQSLSAAETVSAADTGLGDLSGRSVSVPASNVEIARLTTRGETFTLQSVEGQVELGLKAATDLGDVEISASERHIAIERLQSLLERLNLASGQGRLAIDTVGSNSLVTAAIEGPRGKMKIGALGAQVKQLELQAGSDGFSAQLVAASQAKGFSGLAFAAQELPQVQINVGAARAALTQASIVAQRGTRNWQASGDAEAESLTASFANGEAGTLKLDRAELKALQATAPLQLAAGALAIDGVDLSVTRSLLKALLRRGGVANGDAAASGNAAVKPRAAAPTSKPEVAKRKIDVRRVQTLLSELGYAPGPLDGRMGRRTAAAISEFQRREGLAVDGRMSSKLLSALEARAAPPVDSNAAPAPQPVTTKTAGPTVRVGRIALTGNPVLRFRDDTVKPNVTLDTVFSEFQAENFDTRRTDQRTQLKVKADVNELTQVEVAGWISGLGRRADLDIKAETENLQLATFSPYVAQFSGVHLDAGRLDAATETSANQGRLKGKIQLELADIAFRPLSKADAERVAGTVGVPMETAVDLLEDVDGRIALTLPITGTLNKPDVDIGPAVNKAIGGALQKVFPPTMVASMITGLAKSGVPTFEPIAFTPGSAQLSETAKGYVKSLARLLAEHPHLTLKVCGRSTAQDMDRISVAARDPLRRQAGTKSRADDSEAAPVLNRVQAEQALSELAVERKRNVRRYLIKQMGVDAEQVSECRSSFEGGDQGSPRVEVSL